MRAMILAAACLLAACGPSTESSDDVPDPSERALPYGVVLGLGNNWTLTADPDLLAVSFSVDDGAVEASGVWTPPQTMQSGYRLMADEITLDLVETNCTMDGVPYPMRATVSYGGQAYPGCAAMRWDHQLIALMPQIDACIARSPQTRWVTYAGRQADGNMLVRLSGGDASDCTVAPGNSPEVISFGPRSETLVVATEHAALFVRGPGENPGGLCYDAPEVRGADDALLGWMMDPMGC
ncbi:hypothetical protein [Terricaulis sp.]|uniref:hypothetical protein n=1 Tax=Terricaulis sp. TaxID=2768686 RepID=UPI002AC770DB|nr:hypothetical protein [Terricaulis sp.]MDZ4693382.1 hypothetical protein [Terricaulis sp.]